MNKTIYVGIIGTVVLFISGVSVVAAVGHADDVTQLIPKTVAAIQRTVGSVTETPATDDEDRSEDDTSRWAASASTTLSTDTRSHELERRSSDDSSVSSKSHGENEDEGDENESEDEGDDDRSNSASLETTNTSNTGTGSSSTNGTTAAQTFTIVEVAAHVSASSCYTTIGGFVYDLTSWIAQHPGGQSAILSLCGINGAAVFSAQHGGQGNPAAELASLKIGMLVQ